MIKRGYSVIILLFGMCVCSCVDARMVSISRLAVFDSAGVETTLFEKGARMGFKIECTYTNVQQVSFFFKVLDPNGKPVFNQQGNSIPANKGQGNGSAQLSQIPIDFVTLPGEYTFQGTAIGDGEISDTKSLHFTIQASSGAELISPGSPFELGVIPIVFTPRPLFQFQTVPGAKYIFSLYSALPGQSIAEEIVQNKPIFTQSIDTSQFLYPSFAKPLEEGRLYAWQIEIKFPNGYQIKSPIFGFYYQRESIPEEIPTGKVEEFEIFQAIPEIWKIVSTQLQGFKPTEQVLIDGKTVPWDELKSLFQAIEMGEIMIKGVRVK